MSLETSSDTLDSIGISCGADQSSKGHGYLHTYDRLLSETLVDGDLVVILGSGHSTGLAAAVALRFPKLSVRLLDLSKLEFNFGSITSQPSNLSLMRINNLDEAEQYLLSTGPVKVIIEDGTNRRLQKIRAFEVLFWHVIGGGKYISEDLHAISIPALADGGGEDILTTVFQLVNEARLPKTNKSFRVSRQNAATLFRH